MSEWSNVHAWKACVQQCTEGSNPSCCASNTKQVLIEFAFLFLVGIWTLRVSTPVGARPQTSCSRLWLKTCHRQLFYTRRPSCCASNTKQVLIEFAFFIFSRDLNPTGINSCRSQTANKLLPALVKNLPQATFLYTSPLLLRQHSVQKCLFYRVQFEHFFIPQTFRIIGIFKGLWFFFALTIALKTNVSTQN